VDIVEASDLAAPMTVRVGNILFPDWVSLELPGGWSDTFIFRMSPEDGLPPADYARVLRALAAPLLKLRKSASLWVQVEGEGRWFSLELRHALRGLRLPVAVTADSTPPQARDFSFFPWVTRQPYPPPPSVPLNFEAGALSAHELRCLRVLARADCAYTVEVASLAGLSPPVARRILQDLDRRRLLTLVTEGEHPFWKIRRPGLTLVLRSWGLPPGRSFPRRKERGRPACRERDPLPHAGKRLSQSMERVSFMGKGPVSFLRKVQGEPGNKKRRASAGRHRRTARLWLAWLRRAWPWAKVWAGWSEVACGRVRPDALCWGRLGDQETLFWLEVEGGNLSRVEMKRRTLRRVNQALVYARRFQVKLVFTLLGPPWVRKELVKIFSDLPEDLAVVLDDWKAFGTLPAPQWGSARVA
jgi:hypothetical protein